MIIEFAGIDGSGKSTVMAESARYLVESGFDVRTVTLRSTYKRVIDGAAAEIGYDDWRDHFRAEEVEFAHALELLSQIFTTVVSSNSSRSVILTDTYVHRWLATAALNGARNLDRLVTVYRRAPTPVCSIFLIADPATAYARITARPRGDRIMGPAGLLRLTQYAAAFDSAVSHLPYAHTRVSTARGLPATLDEILDLISGTLGELHPIATIDQEADRV